MLVPVQILMKLTQKAQRLLNFVRGILHHPTLSRALTLRHLSVHSLGAGEHPCDHQTILLRNK